MTTADEDILNGARDSRDFVMNKVLEDLNFAVANIRDNGDKIKLSKSQALHMKSRICLLEGTWRKYHGLGNETSWLTQAADAAKELDWMEANIACTKVLPAEHIMSSIVWKI